MSGSSYYSQNSFTLHFGLGALPAVDSIEINWPGGTIAAARQDQRGPNPENQRTVGGGAFWAEQLMLNRREFLALLAALPAFAETARRDAPYLGLKKFIEPGLDEFPMEKRAAEVRRILETQPHDWGKVRRVQFFPLPDGIIRYEAATEKDSKLLYRVGHWRCDWDKW